MTYIFNEAIYESFQKCLVCAIARKQKITDAILIDAVRRAERGLVDADLGGNVIKQRVARPGKGKSGGYRTIVLYLRNERAFFVFGFAKSDRDNIDSEELTYFKMMAKSVLGLSDGYLAELIERGKFEELDSNDK